MIMAIGARWDDRITASCRGLRRRNQDPHHIDKAEFNKIVRPDVSLAASGPGGGGSDPHVQKLDTDEWLGENATWRKQFPLKYPKKGGLRAQHVLDRAR